MKRIFICFISVLFLSQCTLLNEPKEYKYDKEKVLLDLCTTIKNNYSYLSYKKIKIDSLYSAYYTKLSNYEGDRIFNLLYDVLGELKDGHVDFYSLGGFPIQPYTPPRMTKDKHSYDPLVVRNYSSNPFQLSGEKKIESGLLNGNIGYVNISTLENGDGKWIYDFSNIISSFTNTNGIILDIRNNGGGSDLISYYIVQQLLSKPMLSPIWLDAKGKELNRITLNPSSKNPYKKNIVLLQNGGCFSSAEGFICMMRELPNVTTIGDTTGGGSGAPQLFQLAENLTIRISTKIQLTYERKYIEWNGIEPDILIPQTKNDIDQGRDLQLEAAINFLLNEN